MDGSIGESGIAPVQHVQDLAEECHAVARREKGPLHARVDARVARKANVVEMTAADEPPGAAAEIAGNRKARGGTKHTPKARLPSNAEDTR